MRKTKEQKWYLREVEALRLYRKNLRGQHTHWQHPDIEDACKFLKHLEDRARSYTKMKIEVYCTTFCNYPHRLNDGKPIGHACYVLPTAALLAEQAGDTDKATTILGQWKKRRKHNGIKTTA